MYSQSPSFNKVGETKGLYCKTHKLDGMVDVVHTRCIHDGCNSLSPKFNKVGETKGLYCETHKEDGMIDVISKRCIHDGCDSICPKFNKVGEKKGIYCKPHKLDGMVDVINPRCIHENCNSQSPVFNTVGGKKGIYCGTHKLVGMVNVISPRCKTHLCDTIVQNKYRGYCLRCFIHTFPDEQVSRNYKTKEQCVVECVKNAFPNMTWVGDKTIEGGSSCRRPDLRGNTTCQVLIVEVDENKHDAYECSCENKRVMEISRDVGHRPIVFIRFNPDGYTINGNKITSCWGVNKLGIMTIKKTKQKEWLERINILNNEIQYWIDNTTDKTVETIQLYY